MSYLHTQHVPTKVMTFASLAGLALGLTPPGMLTRLFVIGTLGAAGAIFRSLTVEISEGRIDLRFGDGMVKHSIAIKDVASVKATRTTPLQGWGIHFVGDGWLYNVYGLDAVEVRLHNGKRTLIGSDDCENLVAAIAESISIPADEGSD